MTPTNEREALIERQAQFTTLERVSDWLAATQRQMDARIAVYRRLVRNLFIISLVGIVGIAGVAYIALKNSHQTLAKAIGELKSAQEELAMLHATQRAENSEAIKQLETKTTAHLQDLSGESFRLIAAQQKAMGEQTEKMAEDVRKRAAAQQAAYEKTLKDPDGPVFKSFRDALLADKDVKNKFDQLAQADQNLQHDLSKLSESLTATSKTLTIALEGVRAQIGNVNTSLSPAILTGTLAKSIEAADVEVVRQLFKGIQRGAPAAPSSKTRDQ